MVRSGVRTMDLNVFCKKIPSHILKDTNLNSRIIFQVGEVQRHVKLIDLGKSFSTCISLPKTKYSFSATTCRSIQPRTSPLKFAKQVVAQLDILS